MKGFVIKFSEGAGVFNLFLSSMLVSVISLMLPFPAFIQFLFSVTFFVFLMVLFSILSSRGLSEKFKILQLLSIAGFSLFVPGIFPVAAVCLGLYFIYSVVFTGKKYILAFSVHIFDLVATRLALPSLEESNPVMSTLMGLVGVNQALLAMKIFLIAVLLFYSYRNLEGEEENLFLNGVILIGLSMALRNSLLIFSSG